jgi:hypothetical protein
LSPIVGLLEVGTKERHGPTKRLPTASEIDEVGDVVPIRIGSAQRSQVRLARVLNRDAEASAPAKASPAESDDGEVGGDAAVAPVPVDERVDLDQAMMEPDGKFVRREGAWRTEADTSPTMARMSPAIASGATPRFVSLRRSCPPPWRCPQRSPGCLTPSPAESALVTSSWLGRVADPVELRRIRHTLPARHGRDRR